MIRVHHSILFIITCTAILFSQIDPVRCGVYTLYTTFSADEEVASIISDRIRTELFKTGMFAVMEHKEMKKILRKQQFQYNDANYNKSCMITVGHILELDRLVYGSVAKVKDFYTIVLRMLHVPKGEVVGTVTEDFHGDIRRVISLKTASLVQKLLIQAEKGIAKTASPTIKNPAYVSVTAVPERAEIFINNTLAGRESVERCAVPAGEVHVQVTAPGYALYETEFTLAAGEKRIVEGKLESLYGSLKVESKPKGIDLFINDKKVSTTPYTNERVKAGLYKVNLRQKNYQGLTENVRIEPVQVTEKEYTLRYTRTYRDSLVREKLTNNGLRGIRRIVFGSFALLCGAAGVYFNWEAGNYVDECTKTGAMYDAATDDFESHKTAYDRAWRNAEENVLRRNILYGAAGVFGTGFTVSIFF